jgi:hypothetical protein
MPERRTCSQIAGTRRINSIQRSDAKTISFAVLSRLFNEQLQNSIVHTHEVFCVQ